MKKLKIALASKYFVYSFLALSIIYASIIIHNDIFKTDYQLSDTSITGTIRKMTSSDDRITLMVDDVLIRYYVNASSFPTLEVGDNIKVQGNLTYPEGQENFYLFNYQNYLRSQKVNYLMEPLQIDVIKKNTSLRYKIKNKIIHYLNDKEQIAYLKTFILGENSLISEEVKNSYKVNGISHLFATSGMHVTLLVAIIYFILHKFFKKDNIINVITMLFLLLYMDLTSYNPSIIRAVLLFILCLLNKQFKLGIKTDYLLLYLFSVNIIYNPYFIYNNGFLFSYTISYSLIRFGYIASQYHNYFLKVLMTSLISFLASIPLVVNSYFSLNLLTPFLNIIFIPLISFIVFPLTLLYFVFPPLAGLFNFVITFMEKLSLLTSRYAINIPLCHMSLWAMLIYYIVIYFVIQGLIRKKYHSWLILVSLVFIHYHFSYLNTSVIINILNVGQGDTTLIRLPHNGGNILIDCANKLSRDNTYNVSEYITIPTLKALGVHKLDYVILTHGDYDHIGGMEYLVKHFKVANVIFNQGEDNLLERGLIDNLKQAKINYFKGAKTIKKKSYQLIFLNTGLYDNENDNSNVIYFKVGRYSFLFMGDAGVNREIDIIKKYNLNNITFLKVGHHGSDTSTSSSFVSAINPCYAIISVGLNNRYNHPKESVLNILKKSKILRTDQDGGIEIVLNKKSFYYKNSMN